MQRNFSGSSVVSAGMPAHVFSASWSTTINRHACAPSPPEMAGPVFRNAAQPGLPPHRGIYQSKCSLVLPPRVERVKRLRERTKYCSASTAQSLAPPFKSWRSGDPSGACFLRAQIEPIAVRPVDSSAVARDMPQVDSCVEINSAPNRCAARKVSGRAKSGGCCESGKTRKNIA